ncbi:hepatitis A virus cellular receptor 1 homolog [Astatotilapia calliptera]|uniref:hepatitis A virus cellular receptor 1 homolog n=1 Tax=Astatotilapia calliptera TaxID=8154 RepID=UPI000E421ACE|nr:hepatitis A virus cellular receptor 1 homolog [Astatotilapia calliptera]
MKLRLLLALLSVCECDSSRVKGHTGQDVTLPCKYDRKYHAALSACWQRGEIPFNKCSNQLISTDGLRVLTRASSRYELLGRLADGDVSLTIKSLTEGDAGRYGCRVHIPGWFNDEKHHFDLSVATDAPTARTTDTPTESTSSSPTEGHVTSTESPLTASSGVKRSHEGSQTMAPLIAVLLVFVFLLTLGGLVVAVRRLKQLVSTPQEKVGPGQQVQFSSTASTLQLQSSTVDNIYQMESDGDGGDGGDGGSSDGGSSDGGGCDGGRGEDGGDYEYCP